MAKVRFRTYRIFFYFWANKSVVPIERFLVFYIDRFKLLWQFGYSGTFMGDLGIFCTDMKSSQIVFRTCLDWTKKKLTQISHFVKKYLEVLGRKKKFYNFFIYRIYEYWRPWYDFLQKSNPQIFNIQIYFRFSIRYRYLYGVEIFDSLVEWTETKG